MPRTKFDIVHPPPAVVITHPHHMLNARPGLPGDRGCPRCGKKMLETCDAYVADARGRYWCLECVALTLGQHTRANEDRANARFTWDFPITYAHGCSEQHDPGIACKHGACCADCMPNVCNTSAYDWWKNRSDPQ